MRSYAIRDDQWERIEPLLPGKKADPGRTAADNRLFIGAVLWIGRTGAPWRDLPERFSNWNSVFQRTLQLMVERVTVRVHQCAAGQKTNATAEALGCSRGGLLQRASSTKVHAAVDALGNPLRFILTPGQRADITQAEPLIMGFKPGAVIGDKGFDSDRFIACIEALEAEAVIPSKKNRIIK